MPKKLQFTAVLQSACEAVEKALARAGVPSAGEANIVQIAPQEHRYETVVAAHYIDTDMRRIILACDETLTGRLCGAMPEVEDGDSDSAARGLAWLGDLVRAELVGSLGACYHDQPFLFHEAERFRIRITGARNFLFRVPTDAGDLLVVIDLQPRSARSRLFSGNALGRAGTIVDQDSQMGIEDPEVIGKIFKHLTGAESDVEIKVAIDRDHFRLLPATVLEAGFDPEQGRFAVTAAGLDRGTREKWYNDEVELVFFVQQTLLQGTCPVIDVAQGYLSEKLHLPLLQLRFPDTITYGQRRGAFRIVPFDHLLGTVSRLVGACGEEVEAGSETSFRVLDVSYTGMRVGISVNTILSGLKWGTSVSCYIYLPAPYRSVTIRGIIRSLLLTDGNESREADIGIEFRGEDEASERGLKEIRKYIENYHRSNLQGGVEVEACQV